MSAAGDPRWVIHRLPVLAVVCLLVLSGCSELPGGPSTETSPAGTSTGYPNLSASPTPTADGTPETSPSDSTPTATATPRADQSCESADATTPADTPDPSSVSIPVNGDGSLQFDVNRTYVRTMRLLGGPDTEPPEQIYLYRTTPYQPTVTDPVARTLLDARESTNFSAPRGKDGVVMGLTGEKSALERRFTVSHEYVHGAQFQTVSDSPAFEAAFADAYEQRRIGGAIIEGGASYAAVEYMLRHSDHSRQEIVDATDEYRNASPAGKYAWAPYHFGQQYVASQVDSPAEHWCVYQNPPETTEELIHGLEPGSEPVRPLTVTVDAQQWTEGSRETRGEMFVRVVLAAELAEQRAATGADGWGNDELVHLESGEQSGFVWAIRWDEASDADEFRETFGAAMDARNTTANGDGRWTTNGTAIGVERVGPETTVVVAGPESFVTSVEASGGNESVTVTTSDK